MSSLLVGATCGSINGPVLSDAYGRRIGLLMVAPLLLVGSLLCAFTHSFINLIFGRFVVGVAVGALSTTVPVSPSEQPTPYADSLISHPCVTAISE